jgi:inner membrane protein
MPFSERWFYGDSLFIVDPWLWLAVGGAAFLGARRRGWGWVGLATLASLALLLAGPILPTAVPVVWACGIAVILLLHVLQRRYTRHETVAAAGLLVACAYIGVMVGLSFAGERWVRGELERRAIGDIGRVMVGPAPAAPLSWEVVAETPESYHHGVLRWQPGPVLSLAPTPLPRPDLTSAAVAAARAAPEAGNTLRWMRFPWVRVERSSEGFSVQWLDARYVVPPQPTRGDFGQLTVRLDHELRPLP